MKLAKALMSGIALALVAAACGDSTKPERALTEAEAVALVKGTTSLVARLLNDTTIEPISVSGNSAVYGCPQGGEMAVSGAAEEEQVGDTSRLKVSIVATPDGCNLSSDGMDFTTDGDPSVRIDVGLEIIGLFDEVNVTGGLTGGLGVELEDARGSCVTNLTLKGQPDPSNPSLPVKAVLDGNACGHTVAVEAGHLISAGDS